MVERRLNSETHPGHGIVPRGSVGWWRSELQIMRERFLQEQDAQRRDAIEQFKESFRELDREIAEDRRREDERRRRAGGRGAGRNGAAGRGAPD